MRIERLGAAMLDLDRGRPWRALLSPETLEQGLPLPDRGDLAHRKMATTGDRSVLNGLETAVAVAGKPLERGETS